MDKREEPSSLPPIADELKETMIDIRDFILQLKERSLGFLQQKIILNRKIEHLKQLFNQVNMDFTINADAKADFFLKALPILAEALNHLPTEKEFQEQWMELSSAFNFFLIAISSMKGEMEQRKIQASANLLAQILTGVPKLERLPELPTMEDRTYIKRFALVFNLVQSTAGVYTSILGSLDTIHIDDLVQWVNLAFWHYKLYFELLEEIDLIKFYEITKKRDGSFYQRIIAYYGSLFNVIALSLQLESLLGQGWHEKIETYGILQEKSLKGVILLLKQGIEILNQLEATLQRGVEQGIIDRNERPEHSPYFQQLLFFKGILEKELVISEAMFEVFMLKNQDAKTELFRAYQASSQFLTMLNQMHQNNINEIISSQLGEEFLNEVQRNIALGALLNKYQDSSAPFTVILNELEGVFQAIKMEKHPKLFLLKILASLFTNLLHECDETRLLEAYTELRELKKHLMLYPRDYLAASSLLSILSYGLNLEPVEEIIKELEKDYELGIISANMFHLQEDYASYVQALKNVFLNKAPAYTFSKERSFLIPLDHWSWLIPELQRLNKKNDFPLLYYPFNRLHDKIIFEKLNYEQFSTSREK